MITRAPRPVFSTLDGLRGVAALFVVTRHAGLLSANLSFPETFLAVDLFFLLSGFVIAYAYEQRLGQDSFRRKFLPVRLIRLYPLYLLGLLLGVIQRIGSIANHLPDWNLHRLLVATLLGAVFLSSALDSPTWTVLPELIANMLYAIFSRRLTRPVLLVIISIGALEILVCERIYGTLDAGWGIQQLPVIVARLTFSFFTGVLFFKLLGDRRRTHPIKAMLSVLVVAVALSLSPSQHLTILYELALVLVIFPLVVWTACQFEPGPTTSRTFRFLGLISYAVYTLHQPAAALFTTLLIHVAHLDLLRPGTANLAFLLFMVLLVIASWLIDACYDTPIRKALARRLGLHPSSNQVPSVQPGLHP